MAKPLVPDELWAEIEPLLPPELPKHRGGRPRFSGRAALTGIIFVLKSGIPWEMLPQEMGCGSGMSCWRRLQEWHQAGVWSQLMQRLQQRLSDGDRIEWSRACLDSQSIPAPKGGSRPGPTPLTEANPAASTTCSSTVRGCR